MEDKDESPSGSRPHGREWDVRARPKKKSKVGLIVGLSVSGGLLLMGGGVLLFFLLAPSEVDSKLADLKGEDWGQRVQALAWFLETDTNVAQRAKVAETFEKMIFEGNPSLSIDDVLRAYLRWADKDNVPAMVRIVENPPLPIWDPNRTALVMEALGRMQDERAIEPLTKKLPDFVLRNAAVNSLKLMGRKAEDKVVAYLFHNDPSVRLQAQRLLADYGTKPQAIAAEALRRLTSKDATVQRATLVWFTDNAPSEPTQRSQVAKILATFLDDTDGNIRTTALRALKLWVTKDCLAKLLEFAKREAQSPFGNQPLIEVLEQIKDETAAQAIALQLPNFFQRANASRALLNMGPLASKAVLQYLNHPDFGVHGEARRLCPLLKVSSTDYLQQTLEDIQSEDAKRRQTALQYLAKVEPGERVRPKVAKALNAVLLDMDPTVRGEALNAVKVWGSKENTATLVKLLDINPQEKKPFGRDKNVIEVLGMLKDPEAAGPLAKGLTNFFERPAVSKALKDIGSAAEEAVIPYLQSQDGQARTESARILGDIGTKKSIEAMTLAVQVYRQDFGFVREAQAAAQAIAKRTQQ
jgi:HEAT repeat protein